MYLHTPTAMIDHLDHLVLTTARREACIDFYSRVLGMALETFVGGAPPVERQAEGVDGHFAPSPAWATLTLSPLALR